MADNKNEEARNMGGGNPGDQSQQAPGRGGNDDFATGNRGTGGSQTSNRESDLDREDREREQPGSKQHDKDQNR